MSNLSKPLPAPTLSQMIPPTVDHVYFEHIADHPFQPSDTDYSLTKAWWLAEASLLAYADESFVRQRFGQAGLLGEQGMRLRFFVGLRRGTQCYVADDDRFAIVAFRGTQIESFPDPILHLKLRLVNAVDCATDLDCRLSPGTHVHLGFSGALDEIWDDLRGYLDEISTPGGVKTFWFTGHSLGAALATIAAARYGDRVQGVYTFGSPRIGDESFRSTFPAPCFRFVNNTDCIAHVPPPSVLALYSHVGTLKFIDSAGKIVSDPTILNTIESYVRGNFQMVKTGFDALNPLNLTKLKGAGQAIRDTVTQRDPLSLGQSMVESFNLDLVPMATISDHAPIYYALKIWNALAKVTSAKSES